MLLKRRAWLKARTPPPQVARRGFAALGIGLAKQWSGGGGLEQVE